jgi:hypothetical protein
MIMGKEASWFLTLTFVRVDESGNGTSRGRSKLARRLDRFIIIHNGKKHRGPVLL